MRRDLFASLPILGGLLAAGCSSIPTSLPPTWLLDKAIDGPILVLDRSHATATYHATVQATEPSVINVRAHQGNSQSDAGFMSGAIVNVTFTHEGDPPYTEHAPVLGSAEAGGSVNNDSCVSRGNCPASVTVTFALDPTSASPVTIAWTLRAVIQGEGLAPPAGESVDVQLE
jgi:hypothetical protein